MDWSDEGIVLTARPYAESSAVLILLTREHGRHAGLVKGVTSPRMRGLLQPGNRLDATWSARLSEHLGSFRVELRRSHAPDMFDDPLKLSGLAAAASIAERCLPEREPHLAVFEGFLALMTTMEQSDLGSAWIAAFVQWELGLLAELGFGLDLGTCAVTGSNDDLTHVSPRSGRAVSASAAEPYIDRLLKLPDFLAGRGGGDTEDMLAGLALTGHFLERHVLGAQNMEMPAARARFVDRVRAVGS